MSMKIIINDKENNITINKSKFIGFVKKVYTKNDIDHYLSIMKEKYPDATHICYAYILENTKKYSDDKEPMGTAGIPILSILEKNNLDNCLAIVVRYFGGVKLGANGLVRAYTNTIKDLITNNIKDKELGYLIRITEEYNKLSEIEYILKDNLILKKEFNDKVLIETLIKKNDLDKLNHLNYQIIKEEII